MNFEPDIVLLPPSPSRDPILMVEIDNHEGLTEDDARRRFADLPFDYGSSKYHMVVSQDVAFWWRSDEPNYVRRLAMNEIFERFIPDLENRERLYGFQVEMIVSAWLSELAAGWRGAADSPEDTLAAAGVLDAIRGARVHKSAPV